MGGAKCVGVRNIFWQIFAKIVNPRKFYKFILFWKIKLESALEKCIGRLCPLNMCKMWRAHKCFICQWQDGCSMEVVTQKYILLDYDCVCFDYYYGGIYRTWIDICQHIMSKTCLKTIWKYYAIFLITSVHNRDAMLIRI